MDACTAFCGGLNGLLGSFVGNLVLTGGAMLFVWLKGRQNVTKALAPVIKRAEVAEQKAADAHISIARIEGSLRPAAPVSTSVIPPLLGTRSSQSGNYEPVVMPELDPSTPRPRPSMPDPNLTDPVFPRPSSVPVETSKGG